MALWDCSANNRLILVLGREVTVEYTRLPYRCESVFIQFLYLLFMYELMFNEHQI
jgi:hypothetical protein